MVDVGSSDRSKAGVIRPVSDIRHLSEQELAALGVSEIAYVKRVPLEGGVAYAIHAADGTPMAIANDAEVAIAAIREHGMEAVRVH